MISHADHCVYCKRVDDHFIYVVLYVNDMLLVVDNLDLVKEAKSQLSSKFDMKDIGATHFILGMDIKRDRSGRRLWLNHSKYIETILKRLSMHDSRPVKVPIPVGAKLSVEQCPKTQEET